MMSLFGRNDISTSHSAGDSTTPSNATAIAYRVQARTVRLFIERHPPAGTADQEAKEEDAGDQQHGDRAAVAPIGEIEGLHEGVIVGDLGRPTGPAIGQQVDQRKRLDAV